jgi:hypothetical protein
MPRKRHLAIAVLFIAVAAGLGWMLSRSREPAYHGKPLTAWLEQYDWSKRVGGAFGTGLSPSVTLAQYEAADAIRQIGTNGIPILLRLASAGGTPLNLKVTRLFNKASWLPDGLRRLMTHYGPNSFPPGDYQDLALEGFSILGAAAKSATPDVIDLLTNQRVKVRVSAASIVDFLRPLEGRSRLPNPGLPNAFPPLGFATANPAITRFSRAGAPPTTGIPFILPLLNDEDFQIRSHASNAIKKIAIESVSKAGIK